MTFGFAWFVLWLVPSSSVVPLQYPMAEHRVYLASVGLFLVAGVTFARLVQATGRGWGRQLLPPVVGIIILGALSGLTVARNSVWSNSVTLWRDAVEKTPRWDTYMAYGNALRDSGDCQAALAAYDEATRISPERLLTLAARWTCLKILGRDDAARAIVIHFRLADPKLTRLCTEARALAPNVVSMESCVAEFQPFFGDNAVPPR